MRGKINNIKVKIDNIKKNIYIYIPIPFPSVVRSVTYSAMVLMTFSCQSKRQDKKTKKKGREGRAALIN